MYRASFARRCLTNRFRSVQDILETRLCKHQKTSLQFAVIVVVAMLLLAHVVRDFHIQVKKKAWRSILETNIYVSEALEY